MTENKLTAAVLFPGQGSQEPNMGRDLAEHDSDYMQLWKAAENISGEPLREIYWDGEDKDMARTRALQPAMTVVNLSLWMFCRKAFAKAGLAGHSLGEFSALAASGTLGVEETIRLTALRGRLMDEAGGDDEGMTALLKLSENQVERMVESARQATGLEIRVANYNTPVQFVVSGKKQALEAVAELAKKEKGRAIPLPVSGAFHGPLIKEANKELSAVMDKIDWRAPKHPVYFNATGNTEQDPAGIKKIMSRQMVSPVKWISIIENLRSDGSRSFFELGPKGVLTRMLPPILKDKEEEFESDSISNLAAAGAVLEG
jgi:[acyl-carrier-protein] S-malonyltransferase